MEHTTFSFKTTVDLPFEEAVEKTRKALADEGFGVLTEINVKDTLKKKLDQDFNKYIILGACNPPLAYKALTTELEIGLMLPCNVILFEEKDGKTTVSTLDPVVALGVVGSKELLKTAETVAEKLGRVIESIEKNK